MVKLEYTKREIYGFRGLIFPWSNLKKIVVFLEIMSISLVVYLEESSYYIMDGFNGN